MECVWAHITWEHAQTVLILIRANVQSSQNSRPSHNTKFVSLFARQPWNLSFRSCTYICGSTGSWCAVTGNHLYDQHVVWIWSVRRGMEAGPGITHIEEVWSRHRVQNLCPVSNRPYVSKLSERAAADQMIDDMTINGLHLELQSAFKKHHSTDIRH